MIKPICRDILILCKKSAAASRGDLHVADDLLDTLAANAARCVGMAANMIGVNLRIIAVSVGPCNLPMINPVITKRAGPFEAEEGCLSLDGVRAAKRYRSIEVRYLDRNFAPQKQSFTGFTAQIIQHEIDHCDGILI